MPRTLRTTLASVLTCAAVALATCPASPARAGTVAHMSPEQVIVNADMILRGTVLTAEPGWTDERRLFAATQYTIRIDRVFNDKGERLAARTRDGAITLSFAGGTQEGVRYTVSGVPALAVGEEAFFFMSTLDENAVSPILGVGEGLYRVRTHGGRPTVFTSGGCGGPPRPVNFRFFDKFTVAGRTYAPDEFAAEIERALPRARQSEDLRFAPAVIPPGMEGRVFLGDEFAQSVGPSAPQPAGPAVIPPAPPQALTWPEPDERVMAESGFEVIPLPGVAEWGQFDNEPDYPIVFNVPPGTWWRNNFIGEQAYWNVYATAVFRFFENSNNQVGWPNGRFECGFLTSAQMRDLYGRGWNTGEIGVCWSRTGIFTDRIVEADIAFNTARPFSNDPFATYGDASVFSIQTVALHELGHAFGRAHAWDSDPGSVYPSIMNYFANGYYHIEAHRVFADDAASIRGAYVPQQVNLTDFGLKLWRMAGARIGPDPFPNATNDLFLDASVLQGNTFFVNNAWIENIGTVARASTIDWWLDPTPYDNSLAGAFYCSSTAVGSLTSFTGANVFAHPRCPANVPPGDYYLCGVIAGGDNFAANDVAWSRSTIRVNFNPAFGPPTNDVFANATAIGVGTFTGSTQFATNDGTANCGSSSTTADVWYRFAVPYSGRLEVDTCGSSYDTVVSLQIRTFNPVTGFFSWQEVACNDDAAAGACAGTLQSFATTTLVTALGNDNVRIRVSGFNGARGNFTLNVRLVPFNNICQDAPVIGTGTVFGTLAGATNTALGNCGQSQSTPDAWYRFRTPPGCEGSLHVNTFGSSFDTVLEFFGFCPFQPGSTSFACNDDCGGTFQSCLTFNSLAPGFELVIRVSRYGGPTGNTGDAFTLNVSISAPANDFCNNAVTIADGTHSFTTGCGTTDLLPMPAACGGAFSTNDIWYRYTAPVAGRFRARLCVGYPESIAVYPGFACPADANSARACASRVSNACSADDIDLAVTAGDQLLLRVGGALIQGETASPIGPGTLTVSTTPQDPRDFNGDGNVDPDDLSDFITCFFAQVQIPNQCPQADFNGDGAVDPDDLSDFITAFFS